jgi:hypothetical protein
MCWTVGNTTVFQIRTRIRKAGRLAPVFTKVRRRLWSRTGPYAARLLDKYVPTPPLRSLTRYLYFGAYRLSYAVLHVMGGVTLHNPDKIIDYGSTPPPSRFSFSFWAFPVDEWVETFRAYRRFADEHFDKYGFRCNCPLVSYYIPKDASSLLSYTSDGAVLTIDPIHAFSDLPAWNRFLQEFNQFASARGGVPLLNQTPFIEKRYLEDAYGDRWRKFSDWIRSTDPGQRLLNPFFAGLLQ